MSIPFMGRFGKYFYTNTTKARMPQCRGNGEVLLPGNFTRPIFGSCYERITVPRGGSSPPVHVTPPFEAAVSSRNEVSTY